MRLRPMLRAALGLAAVLLLTTAPEARAQLSLRPLLATGDGLDVLAAGLRAEASRRLYLGSELTEFFAEARFAGSVLTRPALNGDALWLDARAGAVIDLDFAEGDFGTFELGFDARVETDQRLDEQHVAGGFEVAYLNLSQQGLWAFVPSLYVNGEAALPLTSEARTVMGLDEEAYARLRAFGSMKIPVGKYLLPTRRPPLFLSLDGRLTKEFDVDPAWEAADLDLALYGAAALNYRFRDTNRRVGLRLIFFEVAAGRIPPVLDDQTTFRLGVALAPSSGGS